MLSLLLLAAAAEPSAKAPSADGKPLGSALAAPRDIAQANAAMKRAAECISIISRGTEDADGSCAKLQAESAERVRDHEVVVLDQGGWEDSVEVRQPDGSWLMLKDANDGFFHAVLWVEQAQLYLGYASWYGEYGCFLVVLPGAKEAVQIAGVPVFSPDGKLMVGAEMDTYGDGDIELSVLDIDGSVAKERHRDHHPLDTDSGSVQGIFFVGEHWLRLDYDAQGQVSSAWFDRRTKKLQSGQSAYESADQSPCDAKVLSELWGLSIHQTKMRVGGKLITGESGKVTSELQRAYAAPDHPRCNWEEVSVSYEDAEVLQALWGVPMKETKARIVTQVNQGEQAKLQAAITQAKASQGTP